METEAKEQTNAVDVAYGVTNQAEKTFNIFFHTGDLRIAPSEITIECTSKASGGTAIGGLLGGAIGGAVASTISQMRQTSFQIDPGQSELVYDDRRREISMLLSDGRWMAIKLPWRGFRSASRDEFMELLDALRPLFGSRARQGRLGAWGRKIKVLVGFVVVALAAGGVFIAMLAIMDSTRR